MHLLYALNPVKEKIVEVHFEIPLLKLVTTQRSRHDVNKQLHSAPSKNLQPFIPQIRVLFYDVFRRTRRSVSLGFDTPSLQEEMSPAKHHFLISR